MSGKRRPDGVGARSIRAKLLGFYALAMLAVVGLDLSVQVASYGTSREFEARLSRYHAVHRLRVDFDLHFRGAERLFREGVPPTDEDLGWQLHSIWLKFAAAEDAQDDSLEAFFNVQAARRGLEAYARFIVSASRRRMAGDRDYYQDVAAAGRIAAYVDGYLSLLLSENLEAGEQRYREVSRRTATVRVASLAALSLVALLSAVFAIAFSGSVAAPIRRLAEASARIAEGDLDVEEVVAMTGDEVETLARSFNAMSRNIRAMVEDLRGKAELERKLREEEGELMRTEAALKSAQFANLQDQIRPHFLFNALNTIARTALFEEAPETVRLTHALGRLFRYSLGSPDALVPISEEAAIVREYLAFQELRFGERLRWNVSVSPKAETALIPRFTLQPLAENAVRHGIEPLEDGGSVSIEVRKRKDRIFIVVRDTGIGMDARKARTLTSSEASGGSAGGNAGAGGIGISNVAARLALRYGKAGRISVSSSDGKGTTVHVSIPVEGEPKG